MQALYRECNSFINQEVEFYEFVHKQVSRESLHVFLWRVCWTGVFFLTFFGR